MPSKELKIQNPATIVEEEVEEEKTADVVLPPDSGWSWVVMVASFCCCTIIDGVVFSSSLIQPSIQKEFGVSESYVSWVSSLLSGFYLIAGPFVSALANRFGFRPVTIAGSILSSACFGISYYAGSVEYLMLVYGIIAGIGFSMVYIPAVVIIGFYFEKWRALATGVAMCGSGVGTIIFTPLTNSLTQSLGWRGCLAVQAGIVLLCLLCGLTFRPIQPVTLAVSKEDGDEEEKQKLNGHGGVNSKFNVQVYAKPLPEGRFAYSMPNSAHNTYMGASPKHHYPTAAEVFRNANLERRPSNTPGGGGRGTEMKLLRKSQPTTPNGEPQTLSFNLNKELSPVGENEETEETENEVLLETAVKPIVIQGRRHTVSGRRPQDLLKKGNIGTQDASHHSSSRPMYRDDIFFTGSLTRIPQYQSQTSLGYHLSVTRLPTKQDILEDRQRGCRLCPEAVRRTLSTMLDTALLKSPSFMMLAISGFLTMMGFFVPFKFLKPRAVHHGISGESAVVVISGIGLVNTIARLVCGSVSSFPSVKPLWLNNIAITLGGLATIFSGVVVSVASQWVFATFFGICIACFSALRSIIAVELIGLEKLTNAFGFLMLFQGLAAAIGTPIASMIYDATNSYDWAFYFSGSLILISAFFCYPLTYVSNWEKRRDEARADQEAPKA